MSKKKKPDLKHLEPEEQLKYGIAEELGLLDKVLADGWKTLSSKETGRIGGLMTKKEERTEQIQVRRSQLAIFNGVYIMKNTKNGIGENACSVYW